MVQAEGDFDFVDDAIDLVRVGAKCVEAGSVVVLVRLGSYREVVERESFATEAERAIEHLADRAAAGQVAEDRG